MRKVAALDPALDFVPALSHSFELVEDRLEVLGTEGGASETQCCTAAGNCACPALWAPPALSSLNELPGSQWHLGIVHEKHLGRMTAC